MIGPLGLEATLERSAYCSGENIKLKAEIQNGSDQNVWLICRLMQVSVRGALGVHSRCVSVVHPGYTQSTSRSASAGYRYESHGAQGASADSCSSVDGGALGWVA